jgi:hypothetical protein
MPVTLICIAVPTIIPLYLRLTRRAVSTNGSGSSGRYQKHSDGTDESHELRRIKPPAGMELKQTTRERKQGVNGPFNEVNIGYTSDGNHSDRRSDGEPDIQAGMMTNKSRGCIVGSL